MNKSAYLSTLTPLRGIAALFVVVLHAQVFVGPVIAPTTTHFISKSWLWVDFFFVLSGFVLSHVYGHSFAEPICRSRFWPYIGARFARIYPLHFFTLFWTALVTVVIHQQATSFHPVLSVVFSYWGIPTSLLLVQALHIFPLPPLNTPAWSLSTEWWVYLLFPFLVYWLQQLGNRSKGLVWLSVVGVYAGLMYYVAPNFSILHQKTINLMADWGFFRCLIGFMLGLLCYEVYKQGRGRQLMGGGLFLGLLFGSALGCMHVAANDLVIIALFPFIILSAAYQRGWVKRVLNTKPLQRLGDWSFSIYMVHVPIIFTFYAFWVRTTPNLFAQYQANGPLNPNYRQGQLFAVELVVLTLIVSALTYRFIEVPARNYLNARFRKRRSEPVAVAL